MVQTQLQPPDDAQAKEALIAKLKGYLKRLQNLLSTILYGDTDKIDIDKNSVESFKKDLKEIAKGIDDQHPVQRLLKALPWVDGLLENIEKARNELRLIGILLDQSKTEKNVKLLLNHYDELQKYLAEAIRRLDEVV